MKVLYTRREKDVSTSANGKTAFFFFSECVSHVKLASSVKFCIFFFFYQFYQSRAKQKTNKNNNNEKQ